MLQLQVAEDMTDSAEPVVHSSLTSVISEEPQEFRHATSLDNALQHLIPTLQSHKGDFYLFLYAGMFISGTTSPALAFSASVHFARMKSVDGSSTLG